VYAKNPGEIFNPQSALGSYVFCLSKLLHAGDFDVYINGVSVNEVGAQSSSKFNPSKKQGYNWKKHIPNAIKSIVNDLKLFRNLNRLYTAIDSNFDYDLILEMCSYGSDLGVKLSKTHNVPLYVIFDAPAVEEFSYLHGYKPFFSNLINRREEKTLSTSTKLVVYSPSIKEFLQEKYGLENTKFYYHQNVDFNRLDLIEKEPKNQLVFGFVGSFLKWHKVDILVRAFEKLRESGANAKLFLLGYGMEFYSIKSMVDNSRFKSDIEMPGFVDGLELLNYKRKITVGVLPGTTWYCAPNKLFEYGAAQMAVVAPNTPTISYLFKDKVDALLFENDNEEALFNALNELCNNTKEIQRYSSNLQSNIRANHHEQNTYNFYRKLIEVIDN
jgi:glycosyltransferase involved in cell wall biosynthesis